MIILGINAYHGDSSAAILRDGKVIAAAEEERFTRKKHWAGFPEKAIEYCIKEAGIGFEDINYIAINSNPKANLEHKLLYMIKNRPSFSLLMNRVKNQKKRANLKEEFRNRFGVGIKVKIMDVEHHRGHMASSFFSSPFEESALFSVDGFGDFVSTAFGIGKGNRIEIFKRIYFPHSLGIFYEAMTQYLGFWKYGDEYKVMGLSAYGEPRYIDIMRKIIILKDDGTFELNLKYFRHHKENIEYEWNDTTPYVGRLFSEELEEELGPARKKDESITQHHMDVAASMQRMFEEAVSHMLKYLYKETGLKNICLAGGAAMNSVMNGKIYTLTPFKRAFIPAGAADNGGAIGSALDIWCEVLGNQRVYKMEHAYLGPSFSEEYIENLIEEYKNPLEKENCEIEFIENEEELCGKVAKYIADGKVIGWFQGRMEFGARALGNRSILADPRRKDMRDILNLKIKHREPFRPFAPTILREHVKDYFEIDDEVPFMEKVFLIKEERRRNIPAVTHVDGTGRLQTLREEQNARYYRLIEEFRKLTGIPIVLNTSFNENEPIVCRPEEALDCFLRTKMDVVVLERFIIRRK
ncbi:MAG: carbamoyltransferase [Aquificae bacterium]|nr:carbamoyltransferase [Aquificota bacterium]